MARAQRREPEAVAPGGLVDGLRAGDPDAFEELVQLYGPRMLAVARRMMRDEEEARDALQDAFVQVVRSVGGFSSRSLISTWLHRVVVNACLMRLRARRLRPEVLFADLPTPHWQSPLGVSRWDPIEPLLRQQQRRVLWRCIERLPERYRSVLVLRHIEGRDTRETALRLKTTRNAVKTRLHRAHRAVAELVRKHQATSLVEGAREEEPNAEATESSCC